MPLDEAHFRRFHETWHCSAFAVIDAKEDDEQAELRACWKRKQLRTHTDKGGDLEESKATNLAWQILRDPESREQYLKFLRSDSGAASPSEHGISAAGPPSHEATDPERGSSTARGCGGEPGGGRRKGWEFDGLDEQLQAELEAEIPKLRRRAEKSFFGFWFHWVPVVDSMWAAGFLLYFASSDIAQAVATLLVVNLVAPTTGVFGSVLVGIEVTLVLTMGCCIFRRHVTTHCSHWTPDYVLRARIVYWSLRAALGLLLTLATWARSGGILGSSWSYGETFGWSSVYVFALRFFMPLVQLTVHRVFSSAVAEDVQAPPPAPPQQPDLESQLPQKGFIRETRTSLMLYYDAWLNSFIVCISIGVVGLLAAFAFVAMLILGPWYIIVRHTCQNVFLVFCCGSECCALSESERSHMACCGLCYACQLIVVLVACTSWAAYAFANARLQEARQHWDADGGIAADIAYGEWMGTRYQHEVMRWKEKRQGTKQPTTEQAEDGGQQGPSPSSPQTRGALQVCGGELQDKGEEAQPEASRQQLEDSGKPELSEQDPTDHEGASQVLSI